MTTSLGQLLGSLGLRELRVGLGVTLKYMFKPKITIQYPEERTPVSPRFRGEHALRRGETGGERCVACKLCEAVCPAQAIWIEIDPASQPETRRARVYEIDNGKCIFCGFCQEACPEDAIVMTSNAEFFSETREGLVYHKQKLLANGERCKQQIEANLAADEKYK